MKQIALFTFLVCTIFKSFAQDLRITEIMYNPGNPDTVWEWVEVYNAGAEIIDLSGFVIDDNSGAENTEANIPSGTILPGASAVLFDASAITEEEFLLIWGSVDLIAVTRWSALNNSGDSIAIWNSFESYSDDFKTQDNAIEQVIYATDGELWPKSDGSGSIFLTDLNADRNEGANWLLSEIGVDTPLFNTYTSIVLEPDGAVDIGSPGLVDAVDLEIPLIVCADTIEMIAGMSSCGVSLSLDLPTATDNISTQLEIEGTRNDGLALTDLFPLGETIITWIANDEAGNQSESCQQGIFITSDSKPTLNCPSDIIVTSADGNSVIIDIEFATATTICNQEMILSFTRSDFLGLQEPFPFGNTTVTWAVLDASGNVTECTQEIIVNSGDSNTAVDNAIIGFAVPDQLGETIIDIENKTLSFTVPFGTNVKALIPNIELSDGANISPESETVQDFTNAILYVVTLEDGTTQIWNVTVVIKEENTEGSEDEAENEEAEQVSITSYTLVNAQTNEDLFTLEEGMQIDINDLPTSYLDIRANTTSSVESVRLSIYGDQSISRTENVTPFALFGDLPAGNYSGNDFVIANYTVIGIPYQEDDLQGSIGETNQINFELFDGLSDAVPVVNGFVLVNADTNEDIFTLTEGIMVNMNLLPTLNLNVRASASSSAESVSIILSGAGNIERTENVEPYALFGDLPVGNYNGNKLNEGVYMISAMPYSEDNLKGEAGEITYLNFELFEEEIPSITNFTLINADTDQDLFTLTDGMVIDVNSLSTSNLDIRAEVSGAVSSVSFSISGALVSSRTENVVPFALFGDFPANNYLGKIFTKGNYKITATGYSELNLEGVEGDSLSIEFEFSDTGLSAKSSNQLRVYPNPVSSAATLEFETPETLEIIYLYDMLGREVGVFKGVNVEANGSYELDLSSFSDGLFFIKSYNQNGSYINQVMIKK